MAELTVTFLGTGTSQGIPVIGCDCDVCASDDPRDKRSRSSIHVRSPEACWVIDTGPDFRWQCLREGIRELDAVVYTHSHTDHIMGFDDLRRFCHFRQGSIPVYASAETMTDLQRVFEFAFNGQNNYPGYVIPDPHVVDGAFALRETELTPLPVPHGRTTVNGYLHSRGGRPLLAYISDCKSVPDTVIAAIAGVDTLVIDALRADPHPTHLSIPEALEVVRRVKPGRTWFTHLCDRVSHAQTDAGLPEGVRLAYDGLKLAIP